MALYVKRPRETFSEVMKDPGREPPPIRIPPPFGRRDDISRGRELVLSSRTSAVTKVSRRPNGRFFRSSRSLTLRNAVTKGPCVVPSQNRRPPPSRSLLPSVAWSPLLRQSGQPRQKAPLGLCCAARPPGFFGACDYFFFSSSKAFAALLRASSISASESFLELGSPFPSSLSISDCAYSRPFRRAR